jgi:hypothetical protein
MSWIGLDPRKSFFTPLDLIPFVGPILKIRKGVKVAQAAYNLGRLGSTGHGGIRGLKLAAKTKHVRKNLGIGVSGLAWDSFVAYQLTRRDLVHPSSSSPTRTIQDYLRR